MIRAASLVLALGLLAVSPSAGQANGPRLNVRTGLWEMTTTVQHSGMPPIPPEVLSHMTPEQRQQFEQHMQQSMATRDQTHVRKQCMTQKDLDRGFDLGRGQSQNCKQTIRSQTPQLIDASEECTGQEHMTGTFHLEAPDPTTFRGQIDMRIGDGGQQMTIHQTMHARWLSADCGDVKPQE